ncbi:hypothetical protein RDWZM_010042 [Blomia tropicalis]|uniref:Uncharacterized protein n=1 Tax=Blomia tropicalis TaxID=40697 RepID=A0A9Q0LYF2_BLOTA|nr:hypothetical protein RDWZM_010042 [Blomia tropicalis]
MIGKREHVPNGTYQLSYQMILIIIINLSLIIMVVDCGIDHQNDDWKNGTNMFNGMASSTSSNVSSITMNQTIDHISHQLSPSCSTSSKMNALINLPQQLPPPPPPPPPSSPFSKNKLSKILSSVKISSISSQAYSGHPHPHYHSHLQYSNLIIPFAKYFGIRTFDQTSPSNSMIDDNRFMMASMGRQQTTLPTTSIAKMNRQSTHSIFSHKRKRESSHQQSSSSSSSSIKRRRRLINGQHQNSSPLVVSSIQQSAVSVASPGNMRMKIMMNPSGFGPSFVPDQRCNYEIYPTGCFDENGSICDTSGSGLCICRPGYSIRIGSVYCLRPASIGEACYTTEQCESKVIHSGCFNYREEYREDNPSAFFGPSQQSWPMGECRCRLGHRFDPSINTCVRSLIGSWCSNVWDCAMVEDEPTLQQQQQQQFQQQRPIKSMIDLSSIPIMEHHRSSSSSSSSSSSLSTNNHNGRHQWHGANGPIVHHTSSSISSPLSLSITPNRIKMANIVCEHNTCNCSQFFHYNQSAEECQFVETYGRSCRRPIKSSDSSSSSSSEVAPTVSSSSSSMNMMINGRRSTRSRSMNNRHHSRPIRSTISQKAQSLMAIDSSIGSKSSRSYISCNLPTTCSTNGTCRCMDGFEYQPHMTPRCQPLTHFQYSGTSGRSGMKGDGHGGVLFERGGTVRDYEGQSNLSNFIEYCLYMMIPALVIIFMFKPCFREWRNHIHQSDSDFYLAGNGLVPPVLADVSSLPVTGGSLMDQKLSSSIPLANQYGSSGYSPFGPHIGCHNAYIFESADGCYAYGTSCLQPPNGQSSSLVNDPSLALVREKLQTIEETQSMDGHVLDSNGHQIMTCCSAATPTPTTNEDNCKHEVDNEKKEHCNEEIELQKIDCNHDSLTKDNNGDNNGNARNDDQMKMNDNDEPIEQDVDETQIDDNDNANE